MSKACRSETNRVAILLRNALRENKDSTPVYYVTDVDLKDDAADVLECAKSVKKALSGNNKTCPSFMLISADVTNLIVVVYVADATTQYVSGETTKYVADATTKYDATAKEWMLKSLEPVLGVSDLPSLTENDDFICFDGKFDTPFKLKDTVRSAAFAYLRSHNLLQEESDEEDEFLF